LGSEPWVKLEIIVRSASPDREAETVAHDASETAKKRSQADLD
jgi:hypothetical protein